MTPAFGGVGSLPVLEQRQKQKRNQPPAEGTISVVVFPASLLSGGVIHMQKPNTPLLDEY